MHSTTFLSALIGLVSAHAFTIDCNGVCKMDKDRKLLQADLRLPSAELDADVNQQWDTIRSKCKDAMYNTFLYVDYHVYLLAKPVSPGCPSLGFHESIGTGTAPRDKEIVVVAQADRDMLPLNRVVRFQELVSAYEAVEITPAHLEYDFIKHNCATFFLDMLRELSIDYGAWTAQFVIQNLDGKEHFLGLAQASPHFADTMNKMKGDNAAVDDQDMAAVLTAMAEYYVQDHKLSAAHRHLGTNVEPAQLRADCGDVPYALSMGVGKAHFCIFAAPVAQSSSSKVASSSSSCPSVRFHMTTGPDEKAIETRELSDFGEGDLYSLGDFDMSTLLDAYHEVALSDEDAEFDMVTNNCANILASMMCNLGIGLQATHLDWITDRILNSVGSLDIIVDSMEESSQLDLLNLDATSYANASADGQPQLLASNELIGSFVQFYHDNYANCDIVAEQTSSQTPTNLSNTPDSSSSAAVYSAIASSTLLVLSFLLSCC